MCSKFKRSKTFLIGVIELPKTNAETIFSIIISKLNLFFDNEFSSILKIRLLISDAAPYALKTGKLLKK